MAAHEFGIMPVPPDQDRRFDEYDPAPYGCVSVDDEIIGPLLDRLADLDCFWHTLARPGKGLACTGITLIPPSTAGRFLGLLEGTGGTEALREVLRKAQAQGRFVIHFGL